MLFPRTLPPTLPAPPLHPARSHTSGRHTLIIPCGGEELNGWIVLRDCIRRVAAFVEGEAQQQEAPQQPPPAGEAQQQPPREGGEGPSSSAAPPPLLDVGSSSVVGPGHPPPSLTASPQGTPVLSCHGRRVFFDVGSTARGHYMRITEVAHQDRCGVCGGGACMIMVGWDGGVPTRTGAHCRHHY